MAEILPPLSFKLQLEVGLSKLQGIQLSFYINVCSYCVMFSVNVCIAWYVFSEMIAQVNLKSLQQT